MEMTNKHIDGITILQLRGSLDIYTAPLFESFFQNIDIDPIPRIIINLANIRFIDSRGLATLIIALKRCCQQQGDLALCGLRESISTIFELTNLDQVFTISATEQEAIAKMQAQQKGGFGNGHRKN
jgi:anti-sigma B factor antagonist